MKTPIGAVMSIIIIAAVLAAAAFGQVNPNQTKSVPSCAKVEKDGRPIVSNLENVEFYVPRFAHVTKVRGVD